MSDVVIKVENVGKQYHLGKVGTGTIANDLNRWWQMARGKEDPYLKIGETNDRTQKSSNNDIVWAIKDINFEVKQGEVLGIIGKNGAGKSTLLKILSRVTAPTIGDIKVKGRIASLLEVGTGFHPDLSGRENIFLNGAILGMTKQEIKSKFDEIVDFSGVERYIDTPVKRYSSGMYVRLAFAVAAHLEPEILIVDEVLAVGDAEFQKKCLGKMKDVSGEGRTVLFVSHQLGSVANLCSKGILMDKGSVVNHDIISNVLESYTTLLNIKAPVFLALDVTKSIFVSSCFLSKNNNIQTNDFLTSDMMIVNVDIVNTKFIKNAAFSFTIQSNTGDYISTFVKPVIELLENKNKKNVQIEIECNIFAANNYFLRLAIFDPGTFQVYDIQEMICPFKINDNGTEMAKFEGINYGYFNLKYKILK